MTRRKRYAVVGTGGRGLSFVDSVAGRFKDDCELVGICDTNPSRMEYYNRHVVDELGGRPVEAFAAEDFDDMVRRTRPDIVIVTTVDAFHHRYIVRAMELGCDAITEKPMTIDAAKCRAIMDAVSRTGRELTVAFNYRWRPGCTLVRKLLQEDTIGEIVHVDLSYLLDTSHGADYSAVGTVRRTSRAACWYTRALTTSTWSTGGWTRCPRRCSAWAVSPSTAARTPSGAA